MKDFDEQIQVRQTKRKLIFLLIYVLYLFLLQFLVNVSWIDWENANIPVALFGSWIWAGMKFAYWCLPVLAYMIFFKKEDIRYYIRLYTFRIKNPFLLLIIPLWGFLILAQNGFKIPALNYDYIVNGVIASPLIEEFIFRAFVLEELSKRLHFGKSNVIQSICFSLNHLPWLYTLGLFHSPITLFARLLFYVVLGVVSGYLVKYTQSIVPSVLLHATNNILY